MSDFCQIASNFRLMSFGAHQLVSEQSDPALESSKEGSSGHSESGGVTSEGQRAPVDEARILSIEDTMRTLTGTVLDLCSRFDKFERMLEEITRSRRDPESPNSNLHQTPLHHAPLYYSTAAQSFFPSVHMSHSQDHAERIRILTASFQKYKARRGSKAFEEPLQKLNGEWLNVSNTIPSSLLSASAIDSTRSGSCREDIDYHGKESTTHSQKEMSKTINLLSFVDPMMEVEKDSMLPQSLHFFKELAKETANFTFQVFIMNHPGQMGSGYVPVLDCHISHIVVKVAEVVIKIDKQSGKEIEKELVDPVFFRKIVWDPGIKLHASSFNFKL